ncbi:MAG: tyrosine-type recombinase/integrase, partial [Chloroflexota bacterium]
DGRLTGHSVARIVAAAAARAGIDQRVTPHGLRHASITAALDGGVGVREVLAHSRHADVRTVLMYDDRRRDDGGRIAALVAAEIE